MIQASIKEADKINLQHHIDIRDEQGRIVDAVYFENAVTVLRGNEVLSRAAG